MASLDTVAFAAYRRDAEMEGTAGESSSGGTEIAA